MGAWTVIITSIEGEGAEPVREAYEVTPPPAAGDEHAVLVQLVTGIHPDAVEWSYEAGTATFTDGEAVITAGFEIDGTPAGPPAPPGQASLFDA